MAVPKLYYRSSEIAFLCLFREIVCGSKRHALETSYPGWKMIPYIPACKYLVGLFLKGSTYIIPSNQYLTAAMGMAVAMGYGKAHGNNGL